MKQFSIFTAALIAGSMLATPTLAEQQRKTLFQVLFPKAHERKVRQQQARLEALRQAEQDRLAKKQLPKVKKTRNYVYKVAAFSAIDIKPSNVEFAAIIPEGDEATTQDQQLLTTPKSSLMTEDLHAHSKLALKAEKHLAKAISEFYSENQSYHWVNENGEWTAKARSVRTILERAGEHGLRPQDYAVKPVLDDDPAKARLQNEIAFSIAVLRYAMDAEFGAVNPNRLSGYHSFPVHDAQSADVIDQIYSPALPARTLLGFHPQNEKYAALKAELAELAGSEDDVVDLPAKVLIKPGMKHADLPKFVAAIRKRGSNDLLEAHKPLLEAYFGGDKYTPSLVALVKDYQKEAGLGADGIIGSKTSAKLAGIKSIDKINRVKLAMERLRWHPNRFGQRHVLINQPEYRARYIVNGDENLSMRVVVGKKSNQTNFFYDEIEHVVYNPYWGVPRSIIVNEFLPKSIGNPGYLDQKGYEVSTFGGKRMSSASVNWSSVGTNPNFMVRQPPGPKNALGQLKIMFPNKHSIYMHDTPSKSLFNKQRRAFSHGCVRLHDPHAMAAAVLGKTKAQVKASISNGKNQTVKLKSKIPVYVSYFTAWPQQDGTVKYFSDVYGRDSHLLKAMDATAKVRAANLPG